MRRSAWVGIGPAARSTLAFMVVLTAIAASCAPASAAVTGPAFAWPGAGALGTAPWSLSRSVVAAADTTPPVITITSPTDGQHVALNSTLNAAFTCQDELGGTGASTCTSNEVTTATAGPHVFTVTTSDVAGNMDTKSVTYIVDADTTAPVITITSPVDGQHYGQGAPVTPVVACSDAGSGVASCIAPELVDTSTVGPHSYMATAVDNAGNPASKTVNYVVDPDTTDPVITITTPNEGQHFAQGETIEAAFACSDASTGSGVSSCTASGPIDTEMPGPHAFVVVAADFAGNSDSKTVNYVVDADITGPAITITTPAEGQHFAQGAGVTAVFGCTDPSGTTSCNGFDAVDTAAAGAHTFTVTSTDGAGNGSTKTVNYVVDASSSGGGTGGTGTGGTGTGGTGTGATGTGGTGTGATGTDSSSGAGSGPGPLARFALGPLPSSFTPSASGAIRLLVRCTSFGTCRGTAKITVPRKAASARSAAVATIVIASARYSVAAKKSARIVIKLNPIGRKRVRLSRAALRATLTVTPADHRVKAVKRAIKLKRAAR